MRHVLQSAILLAAVAALFYWTALRPTLRAEDPPHASCAPGACEWSDR